MALVFSQNALKLILLYILFLKFSFNLYPHNYIKMKKTFLLSFFLLFGYCFSQNVSLSWNGSTVMDFGTEKINVPFFSNENFSYESGNIYYTLSNKDSGKKLKAQNLKWEKIDPKELYSLDIHFLPETEESNSSLYFNKYDHSTISYLKVATFKKKNHEVFRLASFDAVPDNAPDSGNQKRLGTTDNPLKSGTFYKIKVDRSGVFKISSQFLRDNGINPASVNPKNFRIYGNGGLALPEYNQDFRFPALQEDAIQVVGEDDGVWNDGDYALFYAQGPSGYNLYDQTNGSGNKRVETRIDRPNNFINIYEDFSYYFINFDIGSGKRVQDSDTPFSAANAITTYDAYQFVNEEKFNLMHFGRVWVGDSFNTQKTLTFNTVTPIQITDAIRYRVRVVGLNSTGNKVDFSINGLNPVSVNLSSNVPYFPITYTGIIGQLQGNQISLNINPNLASNPNGQFYFDYAEVQYKENLNFNGQQMNFRAYQVQEGMGNTFSFRMSNTSGLEQVWDVSDITNAKRKINKSGDGSTFDFGYVADSDIFNNEFVAFNASAAYNPLFVGRIENQDLSGLQGVDYLMITSPEFMGHAQRLANYYQGKYNVAVVDLNKIYNEYSSGSQDITAIRDFVTKLNTPNGSLKYVFILGDSSYDFRGRTLPGSDIVPSYQSEESGSLESSYVSDDYFVSTAVQTAAGSNFLAKFLPDIPIGRLPAANLTEAKLLIDKTLAYYNGLNGQSTPFGEWRMKMDFVVDNREPTNPFPKIVNDALVASFETPPNDKKEYNLRKLYLDSFTPEVTSGGVRYPQVNQAISNDVGNSLFLFYFGHGGINGWAQARVLTTTEVQNFNNYNNIFSRFPLVSTITCEFTLWDDPQTFSVGEQVMKNSQGGAATMITSSRKIATSYGVTYTTKFLENVFKLNNDHFYNLGDAFLKSKIEYGPNINHLMVNFLGDPAGRLSRPDRFLTIDTIDSPVPGQIRALDFVKIKGHVKKADGTLDATFNGRVAINIFDKKLNKTTLDGTLTYVEEGSPIVKASGNAVNGNYTVEFFVPKDINYEIGTGRILGYADNKVYDVFVSQSQTIGGINPNGIQDNLPPVSHLYMNNTNFANGGITDQNPMLLACVTDDTGINSTGSGIGHDITTYLDGQIINTVVLNDFYSSGEGFGCANPALADYQKGFVTYPFRNLSPGEHQLTFKIWDINNNSTTSSLNFIVKDESQQKLIINRLLNWPNPFTDKTYIQFEHNCDDILDVNVQIYTITGKLVRTLSASVTAEPFLQGFRTPRTAIEWDGKDDFGEVVAKGTYIFKVYAKSQNQDKCKGGATGVEKMVLLK